MTILIIVKESLSVIVPIITLILVGIGLKTWKIQLKGENNYKLSLDALRELKLTLLNIDDYRNPAYFSDEVYAAYSKHTNGKIHEPMNNNDWQLAEEYAEIDRWNKIIEQFNVYTDKLLRLAISINDYNIDLIDGKRLKDYLIEMNVARIRKKYLDKKIKNIDLLKEEERIKKWKELEGEEKEIFDILFIISKDKDFFGKNLEQYFELINKRLRIYIK